MTVTEEVKKLCESARLAVPAVALAGDERRNAALIAAAESLVKNTGDILAANEKDLAAAKENGVPAVMLDRLRLDAARVRAMADACGR